jgi:Methyltransferase domain
MGRRRRRPIVVPAVGCAPMPIKDTAKTAIADAALRTATRLRARHYIGLDYPPNQGNLPRYTAGKPHARLLTRFQGSHEQIGAALDTLIGYQDDLRKCAVTADHPLEPSLVNGFLPGLDSAAIYGFLRDRKPNHYVEIGSGNSTKFAARARRDGSLPTKITSIDPEPRAEINELCDQVLRVRFEQAPLDLFDTVSDGDIVFFDGSHSVYMGNDVTVFFLDVLPNLPPGVLVGIHDIYLPFDYPEPFAARFYTEQYMLAAWLLGGGNCEIVLPSWYAMTVPELAERARAPWSDPRFREVEPHGVAFWLLTG